MGQMQSSVPPAVLQSLQMYGENKAQSANMAQRGAMHRDEMELQAAQFEAKVRMEQQGLEFQKQQAQQQNELAKAQLGEQEKERALRETLATRAEQAEIKKMQANIKMAQARLMGVAAMAPGQQEIDAAATEQEAEMTKRLNLGTTIAAINELKPGDQQKVASDMQETIMLRSTTLQKFNETFLSALADQEVSMFADGRDQLGREEALAAESSQDKSTSKLENVPLTEGTKNSLSVDLKRAANMVPGLGGTFDPSVADVVHRAPLVSKAVFSRLQGAAQEASTLLADPGQQGAAAGALAEVAQLAANMSAISKYPNGQKEMLTVVGQRLQKAVESAKAAGIDEEELYTAIQSMSTFYAEEFGKKSSAAMGGAAAGENPQRATAALNQDAKMWFSGMTDAIESVGVVNVDKKVKEEMAQVAGLAEMIVSDASDLELTLAIADAPASVRDKLPEFRAMRESRGYDTVGNLREQQELSQGRELAAARKGRKAQRGTEAAGAQAISGGLSDVMKFLDR